MRRLYALLLILFFVSTVYSQNNPAAKTEVKTDPKADVKTEVKAEVKTDAKTENRDIKQPADNEGKTEKVPDGYGNLTWGMYLSETKDKLTGALTYTDDKKVIVAKDKELEYYYGFFYKQPSEEKEVIKKDEPVPGTDKQAESAGEKDEGRLFYVSISFPYLDKDQVYDKIQKKYGKHTGENIKDNQGAIAWDSENTIVIMWVDRYQKKPYCRRIIYISKQLSRELNEYTNTIFNKTEIEIMKKMNP